MQQKGSSSAWFCSASYPPCQPLLAPWIGAAHAPIFSSWSQGPVPTLWEWANKSAKSHAANFVSQIHYPENQMIWGPTNSSHFPIKVSSALLNFLVAFETGIVELSRLIFKLDGCYIVQLAVSNLHFVIVNLCSCLLKLTGAVRGSSPLHKQALFPRGLGFLVLYCCMERLPE